MNWSLLKYFWDFISARNVCCLSWICRSAWNEVQNFCLILLNKSTFENNYILEKKANCFNSKMWLDQIKICICIPLNPKLKFHFESKHRIWWTLCKVDDNLPLSSSFSGISSGIWQTRRATSRSLHLQLQSCPAGLLIGCLSYCLPAIGPPDPIRFFHRHTLNGEDILAPVLLSEQTSSFYFFHIFVPSLPHYRFFFLFFFFEFHTFPSVWFGWSVKWTTDSIHRHKHCKVSIWLSDSCFCSVLRIDYFCLQKLLRETRF